MYMVGALPPHILLYIYTSVLLSIYIDNEAEKAMSQAGIGGSFGFLLTALKYTVMSV